MEKSRRGRGRGRWRNPQPQLMTDASRQQQTTTGQRHQSKLPVGMQSPAHAEGAKGYAASMSVKPKVASKIKKLEEFDDAQESHQKGTGHERYKPSSIKPTQNSMQTHDIYQRATVQGTSSSESSESTASAEMETLSIAESGSILKMARKPGYGTSKRKEIMIVTNFFCINDKRQDIYHYDVDISQVDRRGDSCTNQKPISSELGRQVIFQLLKKHKHLEEFTPVYDGKKNMFTAQPLLIGDDGQEFEVPLSFNRKQLKFCVAIKPVKKKKRNKKSKRPEECSDNRISVSVLEDYKNGKLTSLPEQVRLAYDAVLCHRAQDSPEMTYGSSFFSFQQQAKPLGDGLELRQGYNLNLRFTEKGTAVVINIATAVFHKSGSLKDYIADILKIRIDDRFSLNSIQVKKLNRVLKGVRIQVTHDSFKRKYYINEVSSKLPRDHVFLASFGNDERQVNVEEYLLHQYKYQLRSRSLPLVVMRGGKVHLPIEVCNVVSGQRLPAKKLDGRKTAAMIKHTAIPPAGKFQQILEYAHCASNASSSSLASYGLCIDESLEPVSFSTRVLQQPSIEYSPSNVIVPDNRGVWDMQRRQFLEPAKTKQWTIVSFAEPDHCSIAVLNNLANLLCRVSERVGLSLQWPVIKICCRLKTEEVFAEAKGHGMQFVVVVLYDFNNYHPYHEVKYFSDVKYSLVSQCVNHKVITSNRFDDKVASNLCLKINTKLQGINHTLSEWPLALKEESVLIIGADVVHSVNLECSSIAAVVGCVDYSISKYAASCRALSNPKQNGKNQEIILNLTEMIRQILLEYWRNTKSKPKKILFYRDGISEGQFQLALEKEIPNIKKACQSMQQEEYNPPITYVVVQKRIQARFKPKYEKDGIGRMKNVESGTIVDKGIVDPVNYDFYLISHEGIQGTSKPIYYTVLFDENRVKPDVIQKLTHYLCFVYARCNRSISIPAPVKYADLLAYRAKHYVDALTDQPKVGRHSHSHDEIPKKIIELLKDVEKIQNRMFFI